MWEDHLKTTTCSPMILEIVENTDVCCWDGFFFGQEETAQEEVVGRYMH